MKELKNERVKLEIYERKLEIEFKSHTLKIKILKKDSIPH